MAFVAVDEEENESIYTQEPIRAKYRDRIGYWSRQNGSEIWLPKGTIEKIIGKKLTWEDEPVELKEKIIETSQRGV